MGEWHSDEVNHWHECVNCETGIRDQQEHDFIWVTDKAATELETGLRHEQCKECGFKRSEGTIIPKREHIHSNISYHPAVEATCIKKGNVEYWTCGHAHCLGKYYADPACQVQLINITEAVNRNHHVGTQEIRNQSQETCGGQGYSGDVYCISCKSLIKKGRVIPTSRNHKVSLQYSADCNNHWKECTVCRAMIGNAKEEHTFAWVIDKQPTEQETGLRHQECTVFLLLRKRRK